MLPASPYVRYGGAIAFSLLFLHFLGQLASPRYAHHTSLEQTRVRLGLADRPAESWYGGRRVYPWQKAPSPERLNRELEMQGNATVVEEDEKVAAAFVVLVRESDLYEILPSIQQMEDRFNKKYHYPWIFLNDGDFSDHFKKATSSIASGETKYGKIAEDPDWPKDMPPGINKTEAMLKINAMGQKPIPYGGSVPYRKMCRYQSGYFWRHPLLDGLEYYWRVEPSVKFFCDVDYDPFLLMKKKGRKYGFTVSLYEYRDTITTLWDTTKEFIDANPDYLASPNLMDWISNDGGKSYNLCHFWSNFEIASLDLWRSEAYRAYFDYLDQSGGFFYERWGDAPVHSIAAALFLKPEEFQFFQDIGYRHEPFQHCPQEGLGNRCTCNIQAEENFEYHGYSCTARFKELTHWTRGNYFVNDE
ncbi:hypothetical protein JCM10207_007089 [Rhodosporidiobolus poonsookiae]